MNTAQYIINQLEYIGVKHIFTVVGGGAIFLDDALRQSNIEPVFCLHEQAAAIAAEAYSQAGGLGVVLVTTGPGVTNTITGLAGAYLESTPVLFISGQVNTFHQNKPCGPRQSGFQEVNTKALVSPVVKAYHQLTYKDDAAEKTGQLLGIMKGGRPGPVWLDVPLDIQNKEVESVNFIEEIPVRTTKDSALDIKVNYIIESLQKAKRPVCIVGNGVRIAGVQDALLSFLQHNKIPTLCTWKTFDLFTQNNPIFMGRPGIIASRYANKIQQDADFVLCLGARMDLGQVAYSYENFAPNAKKIIVDIDLGEIHKWRQIKNVMTFVSDLRKFVPALGDIDLNLDNSQWLSECSVLKSKYNLPDERRYSTNFTIYNILPYIAKHLHDGHILVHGSSGSCSEAVCQALELQCKTRVIGTHGLGSMGFGLPAAIGAHFATKKHIICVEGDGSLAMNLQELELLKRYRPPITLIVINNNGYASIRNTQNKLFNGEFFGSDPHSGLTLPDYQKIAKAFDLDYCAGLSDDTASFLFKYNKPCIWEICVDADHTTSYPRTQTKIVDGKITTLPMDQLWPEN